MIRIGHGYDVHKFQAGRKLVLGGVQIDFGQGLLGHSDADVLTHSVCDALLGALALGDIGKHFPDTDPEYEGADSIELLKKCVKLVGEQGYKIGNIDVTVIAQKPKLAAYISEMRKVIAGACDIDVGFVSIKATTEEGLGFTGAMLGISSHAVVLVYENQ